MPISYVSIYSGSSTVSGLRQKVVCGNFMLCKTHNASDLHCPLDVHTGNIARKLKILKRKQNRYPLCNPQCPFLTGIIYNNNNHNNINIINIIDIIIIMLIVCIITLLGTGTYVPYFRMKTK